MHILVLVVTAIGGAIWFWARHNPREALDAAQDVATTVINAPRRIAFRRKANTHPVESIDDPRIAISAIAQAFIELDDLPTKDQREAIRFIYRAKLRLDENQTDEMETLGRWLLGQCNGAQMAIPRLSRRLVKIDGSNSWDLLQMVLSDLVQGELSSRQTEAIHDIKLAFRK